MIICDLFWNINNFFFLFYSPAFHFDNKYVRRKFDSFMVKYRWKYESDKRNRIRRAVQAGRNESAVVVPVLNQTRNIPRPRRAPRFGLNLQYNRAAMVEAGELRPYRSRPTVSLIPVETSRGWTVRKVAGALQKRENMSYLTAAARGFRKRFAARWMYFEQWAEPRTEL